MTAVTDDHLPRRKSWVYGPAGRTIAPWRYWWRHKVIKDIDRTAVIAKIAGESVLTPRYIFMVMMSAGIAILGLLLSSPAVVIGAMLLSPLMSPILGAGFALATGKAKWLRLCAEALGLGTIFAVLFCALIVVFSPLQTVTPEIAARTRPNLFDLMVALFSSLAGSYAMIRGREGTIVGVAIATALMPPLAVIGFGLATANWTVFFGALGLYITNFLTIALTATMMARLYGFRTSLSSKQGRFQNIGIFVVFVGLAIPLGLSLRNIAWEARAQRMVGNALQAEFGDRARISQQDIDWSTNPLEISATVLTPSFVKNAEQGVEARLDNSLGRKVHVALEQFRVGTEAGAAEQAQITQARDAAQKAAEDAAVANVARRLALIAGIPSSDVTLDRDGQRAMAVARPLPGLTLQGYRDLEQRVAADAPDWTIALRPPLLALPDIPLTDGKPGDTAQQPIALIRWAATRTGVPVTLTGTKDALDAVMPMLQGPGITLIRNEVKRADAITTKWTASAPPTDDGQAN